MSASGDSLLRILISTDNHLGVWEKDEERKPDSFRAFEEVLQIAIEQNVDMLLLGGDLYHDNKPSRTTLVKSIELLNKYCLGERPVRFQVLSDQKQNFVSGVVNFHHPHLNIGLPVFTIHGNHDDPAGQDNLSAVDLLSTCGLVNYFGKVLLSGNNMGNITLSPVLLQKGNTKLALYGLGNVRDERLGRLFQTPGCVQWLRPAATDSIAVEDWINVFVLHQNRVQHGATAKNCLQERHLPAFMDLVIWGHEHECIPDAQPLQAPSNVDGDRAFVIQPGSTVATALSEGESKAKHVILLEVNESKWRSINLPLSSVRPFVWDNIVLAAQQPPLDPTDTAAITALLERKVAAMINQANRDAPQQQQQQQQQPGSNQGPLLPLIRLRVDYSGFTTINSQRFGAKFVGKVSNPHDMVLWAKAPAKRAKEEGRRGQDEELAAAAAAGRPEQLDQARIEDLVAANLIARLDILPPDELALALHEFVEKDEKAALAACVTQILQETQAAALTRPGGLDQSGTESAAAADPAAVKDEDVASLVQQSVHNRSAIKAAGGTPSAAAAVQGLGGSNPLGLTPISRGPAGRVSDDGEIFADDVIPEDNMDVDQNNTNNNQSDRLGGGKGRGMPPLAPRGRGRGRKGANTAGGMRQAGLGELFNRASQQGSGTQGVGVAGRSNLEGYLGGGGAIEGLEDLDFDQTGVNPSPRSRGRSAGSSKGRGGPGGRGGRGRGRGRKAAAVIESEEDDVSDEDISDDDDDVNPPTKRAKVARPRRAAATAADNRRRSKAAAAAAPDDDLIDDSDNEMTPMTATGGRTAAAADRDVDGLSGVMSDEISDESQTQRRATQGGGGRRGKLTATPTTGRATPAGAGRAAGSQQTAAGRHRGAAAARAGVSQATPATAAAAAAATQEDGGFIGSSEDEGQDTAPQPASRPAAPAAAGGGRRRVLPASIGNSQRSGR